MTTAVQEATGREKAGDPTVRHYYLDWIRLLATLGVFVYHATRPFIIGGLSLIENDSKSVGLTLIFLVFLGSWGMPLFFLISGAGSQYALRRRSGRQYAAERIQRLLLPFVAGCILFSSFQYYLSWLHANRYDGPFFPFLPLLIEERVEVVSQRVSPNVFLNLGEHLWFLGFLLAFSLLALPLFLWFNRPTGRRLIARLGSLAEYRGGLLLFVVPVVLSRVLLQARYPSYTDWADFCYMFVFFVLGYVLYADERFIQAIKRDGKLSFGVGLAATAILVGTLFTVEGAREEFETLGSGMFYFAWTLVSVNGWCWTIATLSAGMRFLQFRNRWLDYGQDTILPFYVFHHPFIIIVAFFVVDWMAGILVKWLVIIAASFVLTIGFYHFIIRRIGPAQVLFGVKPRPRSSIEPVG